MATPSWPIRVAPLGNVSMGAGLWRLNGQLMVTVVAKVTFSFAQPESLRVISPEPVRRVDEHRGGHPMRSLVGASDLAPLLNRADVTLVGSARPAKATPTHAVRLALASQTAAILDKTLMVVGDRDKGGEPVPFTEMPLTWERSYGGIGHAENPIGMGLGGETAKPPNILPADGATRAVGFAPIPASFPSRRKLLDSDARKLVAKAVKEVPAGFDWSFFQAAPADQMLDNLTGSEWLALDGFSAEHPQLRMRLPGGIAVTRVYGFERAQAPNHVPLTLDTLHIEPDERRLSLAWRGSFPMMTDEGLDHIVVAGTYLPSMRAFEWPAQADLRVLPHTPLSGEGDPSRAAMIDLEGTSTIEEEDLVQRTRTLPFAGQKSQMPAAVTSKELVADHPLSGTMSIDGDESDPRMVASLHGTADIPLVGTVAIEGPPSPPDQATPFSGGAPSERPAPSAQIPGAPWADSQPLAPVLPAGALSTLDLADSSSVPAIVKARADKMSALQASVEAMAKRTEEKQAEARRVDEASQREAEIEAEREAAEREAAREAAEREEAAAKAHEEAESRRREEAEKFRREQEEARLEQERRAREEAEKRSEAAKKIRANMYGGFKRKD